jgi:hypothetical protein
MGVGRWNQMDVAGGGIDPATDRPSSPSPLSVGAQDRPHTLVAKVPPPSRRVCSRRGGGAGVKGVCDPPVSAQGHGSTNRTPRGGTTGDVALTNFLLGVEVRQYLCSDFRTEKNKSHIHFYSKVKLEKPLAARASATARRAPHGVPPPRKVSLHFLGARVVASSAA